MRRVLIPTNISSETFHADGEMLNLRGDSMGTTWSVRFIDPALSDINRQHAWQQRIQDQLDVVVAQMSHWQNDSDLGRFNAAAAGSWHTLPQAFFEVLSYALRIAAESDGAYDPTAGALVNMWGFGPRERYDQTGFQTPDDAAIEKARAQSGWQKLSVDTVARKIMQPGELLLDLSAVAKGFSVDLIADMLKNQGIENYLVEVGGELRGAGVKPDGMPWWVALEQPTPKQSNAVGLIEQMPPALSETIVALHELSIATSGDYRRFYHANDTYISHTIDPRSGYPIRNNIASVTVLHTSCMAADALSTALTVLGVDDGLAFAEAHHFAARFLVRNEGEKGFSERSSSEFLAMLQ